VVAATEQLEQAGNEQYHDSHMGAIFKQGFSFSGYERDLLMLNLGHDGFLNISGVSGIDHVSDGRGSVFGDFDNDGDTDVFLTTAQRDAHFLFRNNVGNSNGFIRVELEGTEAGHDAFGAVVRIKTASGVQAKVKAGGSGYLSQHDSRLLFGLGANTSAEWVEVHWPGGGVQRVEDVSAGSAIRLVQGDSGFATVAESRFRLVDPLSSKDQMLATLGFRRGEAFPNLAVTSLSGEAGKLHDILRPGRRHLLNLWATWCVPCAKEMPELQRIYTDLDRAGVDLVGVSVDLDTVDGVPRYLEARGITYPIFTTDDAALEMLYPRGEAVVPLTVLLDDEGRILEVLTGWSESSQDALRALVSGNRGRKPVQ
jgi:thiol-disulfide isomerase/thioredoxin